MWRLLMEYWRLLFLVLQILVSGCVVECQSPDVNKPGVCPESATPTSELCVIECNKDSECPGDNKCCQLLSCGSICTSPIFETTSSNKSASKPTSTESTDCKNECDTSSQCASMSLCVRQGCKRVCKSFSSRKAKSVPKKPVVKSILRRVRNCTDQCLRNIHCEKGFECVSKGCRNICEKISTTKTIQVSNTKSATEDCNDRCLSNIHCPFKHTCIQDGCRKVCSSKTALVLNNTKNREHQHASQSVSTKETKSRCIRSCFRDADCLRGSKCYQQGCNTFCGHQRTNPWTNSDASRSTSSAFREQPWLSTSLSLGIQEKPKSVSLSNDCRIDCTYDSDCSRGLYCRRRSCNRLCEPDKDGQLSKHTNIHQPKNVRPHNNCQDECNSDADCNFGFVCRQLGCRKYCRQDDSSARTAKQFKIINTDSSLKLCQNQCNSDSDCSFAMACLKNGCKKECVITTTTTSLICVNECLSDGDCEFGNICVKTGCKNICRISQPSQNVQTSRITGNNNCNIECDRNSDCSLGQNCILDGCSKVCRGDGRILNEQRNRAPSNSDSCIDICTRDSDCNRNSFCTRRGCRQVCISRENFMTLSQSPVIRNDNLNVHGNSRREHIHDNIPSEISNILETRQTGVHCLNECFRNSQCPRHSTCVQNGCSRSCEDQTLGRFN
ncbi:prestalk protein-like isoform X2 [Mytilus californianus]|nr:prestalk protein-like isoform X2 [Mytilus californianus]